MSPDARCLKKDVDREIGSVDKSVASRQLSAPGRRSPGIN